MQRLEILGNKNNYNIFIYIFIINNNNNNNIYIYKHLLIDVSKNQIKTLPEDFGRLQNTLKVIIIKTFFSYNT